MQIAEETIDATIDAGGQLVFSRPPTLAPGPVIVTIRTVNPRPSVADVIQKIAADQQARGFVGRSAKEIDAELAASRAEDEVRDHALDAARFRNSAGEP